MSSVPTPIGRVERLLNLTAALLAAGAPVPVHRILDGVRGYDDAPAPGARPEAVARSRRSRLRRFERDKAALRSLGLPLRHAAAGYALDASTRASVAPLSRAVRRRLDAVRRVLPGSGRFARALAGALTRLESRDDGRGCAGPAALRFDDRWLRDPALADRALALAAASVRRRPVRFAYRARHAASGAHASRVVEPHAVGVAGGTFYLAGRCRLREAQRVFRLDRIVGDVELIETGPAFAAPTEEIDLRRLLARPAWDWHAPDAEPLLEVRVALPRERAWLAARRDGGRIVEARPDEAVAAEDDVVAFRVRRRCPFLAWLLGHAPRGRVLEPVGLERELRALGRRTADRHRGDRPRSGSTAAGAAVPGDGATRRRRPAPDRSRDDADDPSDATADLERLRRIFTVIPLIRARPGIPIAELARRLGTSKSAVVRDLQTALLCGVPPYYPDDYVGVEIDSDDGAVRLDMAARHFDRWVGAGANGPLLTEDESLALAIAVDALGNADADAPDGPGAGEAIDRAIEGGRELVIEYWSASSERLGIHHVRPVGIVERGGERYVVAFETGRAGPLTFRLDRIRGTTALDGEALLRPTAREIARALDGKERGPRAHQETPVTVAFRGEAARWIRDAHHDAERPASGGDADGDGEEVVIRKRAGSLLWAASWVLAHGDEATVIEPEALREEVARRAEAVARREG